MSCPPSRLVVAFMTFLHCMPCMYCGIMHSCVAYLLYVLQSVVFVHIYKIQLKEYNTFYSIMLYYISNIYVKGTQDCKIKHAKVRKC